ncbi:hypothetical protein TNCT_616271 [Trichonephila clavata]|uniref:Uncharacterized protein n=1 Tax=Trichonephila clavata TaxID=2740835 RepID=A0A8X6GMC2_TRICU|nr:hypothetical protein TNCT_616271 [Trichonephila clavata]
MVQGLGCNRPDFVTKTENPKRCFWGLLRKWCFRNESFPVHSATTTTTCDYIYVLADEVNVLLSAFQKQPRGSGTKDSKIGIGLTVLG